MTPPLERPREARPTCEWVLGRKEFQREPKGKESKEKCIQRKEKEEAGSSIDRAAPLLPGFEPICKGCKFKFIRGLFRGFLGEGSVFSEGLH